MASTSSWFVGPYNMATVQFERYSTLAKEKADVVEEIRTLMVNYDDMRWLSLNMFPVIDVMPVKSCSSLFSHVFYVNLFLHLFLLK
jgi:hypothetical protein